MFIDLWKPTHKLLGTIVNHSAVDVKMKTVHVLLHDETVRQLKSRVRGGNAYTLVHTVTFTSDMELVPDMCPEKHRSICDGYNVADSLVFSTWRWTARCGRPRFRRSATYMGKIW